jgi:CDP-paratose 2-epimerase
MSVPNWVIVTGSHGLVGQAVTDEMIRRGYLVLGIDNNARKEFFGEGGDTSAGGERLRRLHGDRYRHLDVDITQLTAEPFREMDVAGVVHAAGQPSHDLAAKIPTRDLEVNLLGTSRLLEITRLHLATRDYKGKPPFVFLSTNKVYGDRPNLLPRVRLSTRFDFENLPHGVDESMSIDSSDHSLFGVSKAAADLLVQEYGRAFRMPTACLRCGCLTGEGHAGVEQHGFLAYLAKQLLAGKPYTIFGYEGLQVRDNLHADDLAELIYRIVADCDYGAVFNVGGGYENSCSVQEAIADMSRLAGTKLVTVYDSQARRGDHIVYYSDIRRVQRRYGWKPYVSLESIYRRLLYTRM